ncbi:MAG: CDGSH iron-sulfur domain-containing protein [Bdellovibrionota bacterium]
MATGPKIIKAGYTGKMAICACNLSHDKPFCDGRHRGTSKNPWKFQVEEGQEIRLCQCGYSSNKPFCDGSHEKFAGSSDDSSSSFLPKKKGTSW